MAIFAEHKVLVVFVRVLNDLQSMVFGGDARFRFFVTLDRAKILFAEALLAARAVEEEDVQSFCKSHAAVVSHVKKH